MQGRHQLTAIGSFDHRWEGGGLLKKKKDIKERMSICHGRKTGEQCMIEQQKIDQATPYTSSVSNQSEEPTYM